MRNSAGFLQARARAIDEIEAIMQRAVHEESRPLTRAEFDQIEDLKAQAKAFKVKYDEAVKVASQMAATAVPVR